MEYSEQVGLVCGATAGIGLSITENLLRAGMRRAVIVGRNEARGQKALADLKAHHPGAEIEFVSADVSQPEYADRAVEACISRFGRVDTLVSNAAGDPMPRLLHETPIEAMPEVFRSITSGILLPLRAALPHMMRQKGGSMICIASDAAKLATPGETIIGGAMAAVAMFCRSLAIEARRSGIRVNCITPSIVQGTPLYAKVMSDPFASRLFRKAEERAQLGVVQPDDLAALVVFLAGPGAERLTGQTISVTGGISAA
ncbi:SDR family oxidoreductase [Ferrovibrio sp.]|uniref:SDR family NAD(P)-dependent oxidoreductase n=1 Tax=Ferrovibrio sp. TaxID=1917215 RepID=UPI0025C3F059|nr:SDR family oxidoreductase [Ferrovibrio sp.]MBX3454631.1 SDR family oxidoreductase [Ferrovibrio sp.]